MSQVPDREQNGGGSGHTEGRVVAPEPGEQTIRQVPDRKKLRREYLKQKVKAYAGAALCTGLSVPALLIAIGLACAAITVLVACLRDSPLGYGFGLMVFSFLMLCAAASGLFAWSLWSESIRYIRVESTLLPYVPPVTAETLPVDEILVRGVQPPPVVQAEVLLRATQEASTPQEELLRITDHAE